MFYGPTVLLGAFIFIFPDFPVHSRTHGTRFPVFPPFLRREEHQRGGGGHRGAAHGEVRRQALGRGELRSGVLLRQGSKNETRGAGHRSAPVGFFITTAALPFAENAVFFVLFLPLLV